MNNVSSYLFTQGVLGVACLVLGYVCTKLYNKTERQEDRIQQLQDARLQDAKDVAHEVSQVMSDTSQNMRVLSEKIEIAKERGQK